MRSRSSWPWWWVVPLLLVTATPARAQVAMAECASVTALAARVPRLTAGLRACMADLTACEARTCPECPMCLPAPPARVEVERIVWWPVVVAGVVGLVAGMYAGWRVSQ